MKIFFYVRLKTTAEKENLSFYNTIASFSVNKYYVVDSVNMYLEYTISPSAKESTVVVYMCVVPSTTILKPTATTISTTKNRSQHLFILKYSVVDFHLKIYIFFSHPFIAFCYFRRYFRYLG